MEVHSALASIVKHAFRQTANPAFHMLDVAEDGDSVVIRGSLPTHNLRHEAISLATELNRSGRTLVDGIKVRKR